ncbi:MAG: metallohydrolase [Paenibacillaceae bacterium ZCTH02-B3]|nr:MAG: metallohydrolase [Paenibacillaceae bacterium ZCTH02-B3]
MEMRFTILASGSTGNASVIETGDARLLVDAGLSARKLEQLMELRNVDPRKLDGILITHEHSDHIKGLDVLARKYELPVYANEKTWKAMERHVAGIPDRKRHIVKTGETLVFGSLRVASFPVSHDAAEPVGYSFSLDGLKLSFATDLGYVSEKVMENIIDSDVLILESNHDVEMLRVGAYPWNIKRRILSDVGHLSNDMAGEALARIVAAGSVRRVYLAHLSRDCNLMELARMTVESVVEERGYSLEDRKIRLMDTYSDRPTEWDAVGFD